MEKQEEKPKYDYSSYVDPRLVKRVRDRVNEMMYGNTVEYKRKKKIQKILAMSE